MVTLEWNDLEVDHCLACGGVWLDSGELALMLRKSGFRADDEIILRAATPMGSGRRCPICRRRMELLRLGRAEPVMLDRCRDNHGLWFDRGELLSVIDHLDPQLSAPLSERLRSIFGM